MPDQWRDIMTKKDIDILDWLYKQDRKSLGEDVCKNGHYFSKGKYDFCPICRCKFKAESEEAESEEEK